MAVASDVFRPLIEIWQTLHRDSDLLISWYRERHETYHRLGKPEGYLAILESYNTAPNGAYLNTESVLYIFLGFSACFFFNFRYYIKLETVFSQCSEDPGYLDACRTRRKELYLEKDETYKRLATSFMGRVKLFWLKHRSIFWVDEAEFVVFTSVAALFNAFEVALWIFAISQTIIAFWRLFERAYLTHTQSAKLLEPLRK